MSFQFSPEALILSIERRIQTVTSNLNKAVIELQAKEQALISARRQGGTRLQVAGRAVGDQHNLIESIKNQIKTLEEQKRVFLDEINIRDEVIQPINVNLDTGETSTIIETIDTGGISAIIQDVGKKDGIDLKTLAVIGAGILILS